MDLTVKAVSKDGAIVSNYAGTIFVIVDNDNKATVPYAEGYTFTAADQWKKTFSKGLSFTKEGTFKVTVSDFDKPKIEGSVKITVTPAAGATSSGSELVTITSPDKGSTLGGKDLSITGTTKKNSRVQLFLNGDKAMEAQTDDKGVFLFQVKDVDQVENVFSVKVLDGSNKVIGESEKVNVKIGSEGPAFKSLIFTEGVNVPVKSVLNATVTADPGLKEVTLTLGKTVEVLKETKTPGVYTGTLTASDVPGTGSVDVSLKNDLGKSTLKTGAAMLTFFKPTVTFKNIKIETTEKRSTLTFEVENDSSEIKKFEISYVAWTGAEQKALTYEKEKIKNASGAYTWYLDNLAVNRYTAKIAGVGIEDKTLSGVLSEPFDFEISLAAAGKCIVANVGNLSVKKQKDASILSWEEIPGAISYKVFKKDKDGKFVFIDETKSPSYTIHISAGPVKFEEFSIKAVCADKTDSVEYSPSTLVQTGPTQMFFLALIAGVITFVIMRRKKLI